MQSIHQPNSVRIYIKYRKMSKYIFPYDMRNIVNPIIIFQKDRYYVSFISI
jgi:hypothetical protein